MLHYESYVHLSKRWLVLLILLQLFYSSFNSFSTSTSFILFEVTFLFNYFSFSSKSTFFTKLIISILLVLILQKNLLILTYVKLLIRNIFIMIINSSKSSISSYVSKTKHFVFNLIYFSLSIGKALVTQLLIIGILPLASFILALGVVLAAKFVISDTSFSKCLFLALFTSLAL